MHERTSLPVQNFAEPLVKQEREQSHKYATERIERNNAESEIERIEILFVGIGINDLARIYYSTEIAAEVQFSVKRYGDETVDNDRENDFAQSADRKTDSRVFLSLCLR